MFSPRRVPSPPFKARYGRAHHPCPPPFTRSKVNLNALGGENISAAYSAFQARRLARQPSFLASLSIPLPAPLKRHFQIRLSFQLRSALHLPSFRPLRMAQPLQLTKRKNIRIVPRPVNLLLRKSIRSHPGICKPQHTILWGLPKPGNANWALAAAGWPPLHSSTPPVFTASLLHSKSRIIQHRAPSHTGTLDRSNTCLRSLTSRMGRPPPPFRTTSPCPPAFYPCKRAQRNRHHIQSRNNLDCKLSMWLNPFARPDASPAVPAYVSAGRPHLSICKQSP